MRERAGLVDAEVEHGPTADGGWRVQLRIPRDRTGVQAPSDDREQGRGLEQKQEQKQEQEQEQEQEQAR